MANPKPKQQSSLKKYLFIGGGVLLLVLLFPTGGQPEKKGPSKVQQMMQNGGSASKKKIDPLHTKEDDEAKFESVQASQKNSFVPPRDKSSIGGPIIPGGIPSAFAGGEGTWSYTGNMTVDGTPNALLENSATGDGVFLRPGQHWKTLRLVTVKDDSIVVEGPGGAVKTVYFNDLSAMPAAPEVITPLPAVGPNGFNPATSNPNGSGGGFGRPPRNQGGNRPLADNGGLSGPIGQTNAFEPSIDSQDQQNNQFNNRGNRNRRN